MIICISPHLQIVNLWSITGYKKCGGFFLGGGGYLGREFLYFVFFFVVWRGIHFSIVFVVGLKVFKKKNVFFSSFFTGVGTCIYTCTIVSINREQGRETRHSKTAKYSNMLLKKSSATCLLSYCLGIAATESNH